MSIGYIAMNFNVFKTCGRNKCGYSNDTFDLLKMFLSFNFFLRTPIIIKDSKGVKFGLPNAKHEEFVKLFLGDFVKKNNSHFSISTLKFSVRCRKN